MTRSPGRPKYFPGGFPELRSLLDDYLGWLEGHAGKMGGVRALLLGGGYGRGEGGVLETGGRASLYNDLEFYVFATGRVPVSEWVAEGERRLGIEVEFKAMPPRAMECARPGMFYYDLLNAHILVFGDAGWVSRLPARLREAGEIPPVEGSRLLVNRGMSLLRCLRAARGEMELPVGFIDRIAAKADLALGDALLCARGRYHWSCIERSARLASIADGFPGLCERHASGVQFKFHPVVSGRSPAQWTGPLEALAREWTAMFLHIEGLRLGTSFVTPREYAASSPRSLFPEEPAGKNFLRQARDLRKPSRVPFQWGGHPRAPVWRALPLLLDMASGTGSAPDGAKAASLLGADRAQGRDLEERCRACWTNYP